MLEAGPRGLRPGGPQGRATLNLVASVGLVDEVLVAGANFKGAANRYVYTGGELKKLPSGFGELFAGAASGQMLPAALLGGVLRDAFIAPKADPRYFSTSEARVKEDESVFDFAQRRLGMTVATYFIDPLCVGVFGGDARKLSLRSCFPVLAKFEEMEGSVVLGAIRQDINTPPLPAPDSGTERLLEVVEGARVWTLQRGMSSLVEATVAWLRRTGCVEIRTATHVKAVTKTNAPTTTVQTKKGKNAASEEGSKERETSSGSGNTTLTVHLSDGTTIEADHVVSALPANALAAVLEESDATSANALRQIPMQSIVVANFVFRGNLAPVDGFGYLVPTVEPASEILGVVFDSCTFPAQDDPYWLTDDLGEITRITVMSGGYKHTATYGDGAVDLEHATELSLRALKEQIGIEQAPLYSNAMPWMDNMPQYTVGHADRVADVVNKLYITWGGALTVAGASYTGVGVNDCVLNATNHATKLVADGKA